MNAIQTLLTDHLDIWTAADTEKKSGRGRSSGNAASVYGIKKLRELILELAVRGKLVPQDLNDEPASVLLRRIATERTRLINEGKLSKPKSLPPVTEEEKQFDIPDGWMWTRFDDLALHSEAGWSPSCEPTPRQGDNWGVLKVSAVTWGKYDPHENKALPANLESKPELEVMPGDFLISRANTAELVARAVVVPNGAPSRLMMSDKIIRFVFAHELDHEYLTLVNGSELSRAYYARVAGGTSSSMKNVSREQIRNLVVALPPLAEQRRIVAKVDELMALCDQLEQQQTHSAEARQALVEALLAMLTRVASQQEFSAAWARITSHFDTLFTTDASIDQLKQTILQLAVMGKLVPQDPNDEPASALLKRIQAEKAKLIAEGKIKKDKPLAAITDEEKPFALPNNWEWVRLGDISSTVQYGYADSANHGSKEVLFLRITDIQDDAVDWHTVPGCDISPSDFNSYALENSDIVIARTGGTIGKSYLVAGLSQKAVFASYLIRIGNLSATSEQYKKVFLGSQLYWVQLIASSMGTGQPNVNGTALKHLIFSLPPLAEQHRIVAKVDELMALCDSLKARLADAQAIQLHLADAIVEQAVC